MFLLFLAEYEQASDVLQAFTFQYVSIISTVSCIDDAAGGVYLHSNMFLLFR